MNRLLALLMVALAALAVGSCDVNEYCVTCALDDGGNGDGDGGGRPDADGDGSSQIPDADEDAIPPDACVSRGEACNGSDDDCDGKVDESTDLEPLPGVGDECGGSMGECRPGTRSCVDGELTCSGVGPAPEVCDDKDNDCDGTVDDGNPGGGSTCPTDCGPGTSRCDDTGNVVCDPPVQTSPETCDGVDNDCDGRFDEGLTNLGPCGIATGLCEVGHLECQGGDEVCVGATGPTQEICDGLDQDCDGSNTNGFDLVNDPRNCGMCGRVCNLPNALEGCASSACTVRGCEPNFHNNDGLPANGCEYGPCTFRGPTEACNGADDNCNGMTDEALGTPPITCASLGECGVGPGGRPAVTPTCRGAMGWDCVYEPDTRRDVSVDANGDLSPETECDGLDNDCDGRVDESHPQKGQACSDTGMGACRRTGTFICNTADEDGPLVCNLTSPVVTPSTEVCDGVDNSCNGVVDEGAATGNIPGGGLEWVSIGGGREIMKYEASRPDARAAVIGTIGTHACSRTGVQPWINIKAPEAAAVCASMGARLCTELEWHRACSVVQPQAYPIVQPGGNGKIVIEAENFFSSTSPVDPDDGVRRAWVPMAVRDYSGIAGLRASPDTGQVNTNTELAETPRLDYQVTFAANATYRVWVRMLSGGGGDDQVHVGINTSLTNPTAQRTLTVTSDDEWHWVRSGTINANAGTAFVSIWMQDDGAKIDQLMVIVSGGDVEPTERTGAGGTWAYQTNPSTSAPTTCNGDAFDTNTGVAGDQDDIIATGARPACNANWGTTANRIFDLSGNVREWTAPRLPGANPIRGGASNNLENGLACALAFTLADDTFFFPNVGFRCCR